MNLPATMSRCLRFRWSHAILLKLSVSRRCDDICAVLTRCRNPCYPVGTVLCWHIYRCFCISRRICRRVLVCCSAGLVLSTFLLLCFVKVRRFSMLVLLCVCVSNSYVVFAFVSQFALPFGQWCRRLYCRLGFSVVFEVVCWR